MKYSDFMTESYRLIYEIEVTLKNQIKHLMKSKYGKHWQHKIKVADSFSTILFHELIPFFSKYEPLNHLYTNIERKELYNLIPIRNKICHMKLLKPVEFDLLCKVNNLVVSRKETSLVKI